MAIINIHNYEEYMIDYLECNLSSDLNIEMEAFLDVNPVIKEELEGLDDIVISKDTISYNEKESLYKDIDSARFEEKCIAYVENQLSKEDKAEVALKASLDKGKESLLNDFKRTILTADESIIFDNKEKLKRNSSFRFKQILNFAAAAAIILTFSVSVLLIPNNIVEPTQIGNNTEISGINDTENSDDIVSSPAKVSTTIKIEKPLTSKPKVSRKTVKPITLETKRIRTIVASNKLNALPINKAIDIQNTIASNDMPEIIINKDSKDFSEKISGEIALNNNAMEWNENTDGIKTKKQNKNKLLKKGKSALRSFVGKYFYTKKIIHSDEIIINEK